MAASNPGGILMLSLSHLMHWYGIFNSVIQIILNVCGKYKNTLSYFSYFEDLNLVLLEPISNNYIRNIKCAIFTNKYYMWSI